MSSIRLVDSEKAFEAFITQPGLKVVHFGASWAEVCSQMDDILMELQKGSTYFECARIDAEDVAQVSLAHQVKAAPTVILFLDGKEVARVNGFHPSELRAVIDKHSVHLPSAPSGQTELDARLKALINQSRLCIFIKGTPDEPRCGFSRQALQLLNSVNAQFSSFDILSDEQVRQGLKEYSQWSTYPQIYLDGELIGGLDLFREEMTDHTFVDKLPKVQ